MTNVLASNGFSFRFFPPSTCAMRVQNVCDVCAKCLQYMCDVLVIYVQYLCDICVICVGYV